MLNSYALFDELGRRHIDPREFFGENYQEARELADMLSPDYLDDEPTIVQRLRAKGDVDDAL